MKIKKEERFYWFVRFAFLAVICAALIAVVWYCFNELLKPKDAPHSDTLVEISNPYEKDDAQKGDIFDSNGNLLMTNVALDDETGKPVVLDGGYQRYAELREEAQKNVSYTRLLWNDEQVECWSNILPALTGGLDSDLSSILQDIPLNSEEESDVILTLDSNVQVDTYRSLADRKYSSAVVMDCNTGNVLAMASTPSYDYNAYRFGSIPFTVYFKGNDKFHNNTDNTYDCVQDYYKKWKIFYQEDNAVVTDSRSLAAGEYVREWELEKKELGMLLTEKEAKEILSYWNSSYDMEMNLENCYEVNFEEIYKQEYAFQQEEERKYKEAKEKNETYVKAAFEFNYEPDELGDGETYIPFVRYITSDEEEARYLLLRYGSNNFIYEDCVTYGFDPNFSFSNQVLDQSQPGSCFKILLSAQLLDQASENLMTTSGEYGITTLNISITNPKEILAGMPTAELAPGDHGSLIKALEDSSNNYFAMTAMMLDNILRTENSEFLCTYEKIRDSEPATLLNSAERMQNYYEVKFCINQEMEGLFSVPRSKILGCLNTIRIEKNMFENRDEKENVYYYDDSLCYEILPDGELGQAYTDSSISLIKKIGDTAYGQGYNMITPMFMAQTIGKCLTGEMYVPNVLQDVTIEPEVVGEPFDRELQTVKNMQNHLKTVYDYNNDYIPDALSFPSDAFTFYSKTGTASAEVSYGRQSVYGSFANFANYPLNSDGDWEMIWYVGAVSDGTNCYAIVLRSYFGKSSYSLQKEFLTIVDSLYRNGYLKN